MERMGPAHDRPAEPMVGLAARRERIWGLAGGAIGASFGIGLAAIAMLVAGRPCTIAPAADYVTRPLLPEAEACRAVMHHYVANSKRWYFQRNWREVTRS